MYSNKDKAKLEEAKWILESIKPLTDSSALDGIISDINFEIKK